MTDLGFVHRFVPGTEKRTLLLLHGTGGNENDLLGLGQELAPGAALLSPRGQVLENGMPRFFRRLAEGVFDLEDLKVRTASLIEFIHAAEKQYGIDPESLVAVGYSNGANIAASVMLTDASVLKQAVLLRAMVPFTPAVTPDLGDVRALLAAGRRDPIVAPGNTQKLAKMFEAGGAEVTLQWHEGGHELGWDDVKGAAKWLTSGPLEAASTLRTPPSAGQQRSS